MINAKCADQAIGINDEQQGALPSQIDKQDIRSSKKEVLEGGSVVDSHRDFEEIFWFREYKNTWWSYMFPEFVRGQNRLRCNLA